MGARDGWQVVSRHRHTRPLRWQSVEALTGTAPIRIETTVADATPENVRELLEREGHSARIVNAQELLAMFEARAALEADQREVAVPEARAAITDDDTPPHAA